MFLFFLTPMYELYIAPIEKVNAIGQMWTQQISYDRAFPSVLWYLFCICIVDIVCTMYNVQCTYNTNAQYTMYIQTYGSLYTDSHLYVDCLVIKHKYVSTNTVSKVFKLSCNKQILQVKINFFLSKFLPLILQ